MAFSIHISEPMKMAEEFKVKDEEPTLEIEEEEDSENEEEFGEEGEGDKKEKKKESIMTGVSSGGSVGLTMHPTSSVGVDFY